MIWCSVTRIRKQTLAQKAKNSWKPMPFNVEKIENELKQSDFLENVRPSMHASILHDCLGGGQGSLQASMLYLSLLVPFCRILNQSLRRRYLDFQMFIYPITWFSTLTNIWDPTSLTSIYINLAIYVLVFTRLLPKVVRDRGTWSQWYSACHFRPDTGTLIKPATVCGFRGRTGHQGQTLWRLRSRLVPQLKNLGLPP